MFTQSYEQMRAACGHFWPPELPLTPKYKATELVDFRCERSVAEDSLDHLEPRGTARDNTHWVPFVVKCEELFGFRDLRYLDLGCAGGGLVFDFLARRHFAVGLEGSDYSLLRKRAEWATIPEHLFTCDITYPFEILERKSGKHMLFDVIGIWDVLEHLPEDRIAQFCENVRVHLSPGGVFCGTVSTRAAAVSAIGHRNHHSIVQPRPWWERTLADNGFEPADDAFQFADQDFPRGNGILYPADFRLNPESGFHFVLHKR